MRVSPEGPDGGVDIIAHEDELGFQPPIIKVQVKSTEGSVGDPVVAQLYGKVSERENALFVTLGTFTAQARAFERSNARLRLIDGDELVGLILEHYNAFDSRYKGLLPLRQVYVPEPLDESQATPATWSPSFGASAGTPLLSASTLGRIDSPSRSRLSSKELTVCRDI